uniref:Uncharacterized protein n=1 Tax=Tanacetum cinerariifolium TaxID=118510 RepID=A0A699IDX2_TANCI|nr:hypothetical protein [Tanacetum cinerariifolium]
MHHEQAQQAAHDEKLVSTEKGVKIRKSNLKMDPTLAQKEETYQVILDIIKNTPCFNAFLISADVPEIYKQQYWFTIKRVKKSSFYEFDLDKKTCQIDVELFQEILGISLRVPNQEFTVPPFNDSLLGPSRIILWGIYHKVNVDYAAFIWEDLQYQTNNMQSKVRRRRGKGAQGSKAMVSPKKVTTVSKKKKENKIESSDEESNEEEERLFRRKPIAKFKIDTQKPIKASKRTSRSQHQSGGSSEGAGLRPEGSTDDYTFLFNDQDEKIEDIPWVSTDDDETKDDDEEDDASIDIKKTNDERIDIDVEDQVKGVVEMNIVEKAEEENAKKVEEPKANEELKADEEQEGDDQAGDE